MRLTRFLFSGASVAGCLLLPQLPAAEPASTEEIEQSVLRWSQLRAETSRMESEWRWQEQVLRSTRDALEQRLQQLEDERDTLRAAHGPELAELETLTQRNAESRAALTTATETLTALTARVLAMRPRLPPRLNAAIDLPARSLADPRLPLAERVQHLAAIQARCAQFSRMITYSEEVIELNADEPPRLCEVIYWGLAAAYALDRDGERALLGSPTAEGWRWEPRPELATDVARLLADHRDQQEPAFTSLPFRVIP